ncbi:hypothetical protein [Candidatus Cytomitobacter indipagum]|uniref:hypothetical protein n=1 Tax=Candidatus Cytomitobacter indipagum TaxID=2601575 RepID=UPI00155B0D5B|nr:hypothetical protein [Candidatus Cytomitobacter indipagum]
MLNDLLAFVKYLIKMKVYEIINVTRYVPCGAFSEECIEGFIVPCGTLISKKQL